MTIYIKGLDEQLAPALQGAGMLAQHFMNPDKEYVTKLRDAIDKGAITAQELNNMTPEEVAAKFNLKLKNAKQFTTNTPDAKTVGDRAKASEIQRILSLPQDAPERIEYLARGAGIQTPTERTVQGNQAAITANEKNLSDMEMKSIQDDLASGDPQKVEAAQARLSKRQTKDQLRAQGLAVDNASLEAELARNRRLEGSKILLKYGSQNLFGGINDPNNQNLTSELNAIYGDEQLTKVYESQRDDYWKKQQQKLQKDIAEGRADRQSADIIVARKISEKVRGTVGVNDIVKVIQDPTIQARFHDEKGNLLDEKSIHPEEKRLWLAVKAIDTARDSDYKKEVKDAYDKLRIAGKSIYDRLNSPRSLEQGNVTDEQMASLVNEYNTYAQQYLGGIIPSTEIPQIGIDETPGIMGGVGGNKIGSEKSVKLIQGTDPLINAGKKKEEVKKEEPKSVTINWDDVAKEIMASKDPEAQFAIELKNAKDDTERKALRTAYDAAKTKRK